MMMTKKQIKETILETQLAVYVLHANDRIDPVLYLQVWGALQRLEVIANHITQDELEAED